MVPGLVWEIADKFGVKRAIVYYWINNGVVQARRRNNGSPYWITLDSTKEEELKEWVRTSEPRIAKSILLEHR